MLSNADLVISALLTLEFLSCREDFRPADAGIRVMFDRKMFDRKIEDKHFQQTVTHFSVTHFSVEVLLRQRRPESRVLNVKWVAGEGRASLHCARIVGWDQQTPKMVGRHSLRPMAHKTLRQCSFSRLRRPTMRFREFVPPYGAQCRLDW